MRYLPRTVVGGVSLIAFLPVLLMVAVGVAKLVCLVIPYVVVVFVLVGIYRLVLGRGRR
jgi:hypothetical protein